jgi:hypothetical protein
MFFVLARFQKPRLRLGQKTYTRAKKMLFLVFKKLLIIYLWKQTVSKFKTPFLYFK